MATRSNPCTATMVLFLLSTVSGILAQARESAGSAGPVSGISTDRLTPKQLRTWREVGRIAEAADKAGRPLHPTLFGLWQWAKGSGHTIIVDMTEVRGSNAAGKTTLAEVDRGRSEPSVILWLHLRAIDNAGPNLASRLAGQKLPFHKLRKTERYAEIAGHELAHAALMLESPEYALLCSELHMEAERDLYARRQNTKTLSGGIANKAQEARLQSIISAIEKPAEAAELRIWRELVDGHRQ